MPVQSIAIAVVEHEGCFLVGQRPEGVPLAGYWEFPGGKVQAGETPEAAAVRECREETGLKVVPRGRYPTVQYAYAHATLELHFIACQLAEHVAPAPRPPFLWLPRAELATCRFPPANQAVLELLRDSGT
jgi:8-oxo-dGTP diphosphatase